MSGKSSWIERLAREIYAESRVKGVMRRNGVMIVALGVVEACLGMAATTWVDVSITFAFAAICMMVGLMMIYLGNK